jgi:hypothetical protein
VVDESIENGRFAEGYGQEKTETLREDPVAEPLCTPQIPHGLV